MPEFMEEFKFPDEIEQENKAMKEAEDKANAEPAESDIEIVDDTPAEDRGRVSQLKPEHDERQPHLRRPRFGKPCSLHVAVADGRQHHVDQPTVIQDGDPQQACD